MELIKQKYALCEGYKNIKKCSLKPTAEAEYNGWFLIIWRVRKLQHLPKAYASKTNSMDIRFA